MEIKINFDTLFGQAQDLNTTQETPISAFQSSIEQLNDSIQYQLALDHQLFPSPSTPFQVIENSSQASQYQQKKQIRIANRQKNSILIESTKSERPGQRLYYQSQASNLRKRKEQQKNQLQKQAAMKSYSFKPAINKKSRKLAQLAQPQQKQKKEQMLMKSTQQLKQQEELKQCTFQPKILSNYPKHSKSKEEIFYMLHTSSKIRSLKLQEKKKKEAKACQSHKKLTEEQFAQFLKRNEEHARIVKKKIQLLKNNSDMYDFKTGEKLYSPKLSNKWTETHTPKWQLANHAEAYNIQEKEPGGIFRKKNHFTALAAQQGDSKDQMEETQLVIAQEVEFSSQFHEND